MARRRGAGGNPGEVLVVSQRSPAATRGQLRLGPLGVACALGRSGRRAVKREGDGATPAGRWRLVRVLYRADRIARPRTMLPVSRIGPQDGWCDAAGDRNYNRAVRHPYRASAERMWREDGLYDLVVVLDHNTRPRVQGGGSAIFMHVARPGFRPTEGCVAVTLPALRRLLAAVRPGSVLAVGG